MRNVDLPSEGLITGNEGTTKFGAPRTLPCPAKHRPTKQYPYIILYGISEGIQRDSADSTQGDERKDC